MKHDPLDVQPTKCETCPFRINNKQLIAKITNKVLSSSNHICHNHDTKICRGSRDLQIEVFHRLRVLEAPTDEAYKQALKPKKEIEILNNSQVVR